MTKHPGFLDEDYFMTGIRGIGAAAGEGYC
jgi:hypothetical protein